MLAKVTSKGQVTIPLAVRTKLGISKNDTVDFIVENDHVRLVPVRTLKDLRGAVPARGKGDFAEERTKAKGAIARRVRQEME